MPRLTTIARCGSHDRLTVPQMRATLEMIRQCTEHDIELGDVAVHLRKAVAALDAMRDVALAVMREAETERNALPEIGSKPY